MMKRNKLTTLTSIFVLSLTLSAGSGWIAAAEEATEPETEKYGFIEREGVEPEEIAGYYEVSNVGEIEGSHFYYYAAEERVADMTPVIFVYGDLPYADEEAAKATMNELGLIDLADEEGGLIILVNPVGEDWGTVDVDVFDAIEEYIFSDKGANGVVKGTSRYNLQYVLGEGSGATFINNYLSDDCQRIAGVLTVGGDIEDHKALYPLPAYLVSASEEAVEFYLDCNDNTDILADSGRLSEIIEQRKSYWEAEEAEDRTTYVFTITPVRKVIVSKTEADALNQEIIEDAWQSLFRWTARNTVVNPKAVYSDFKDTSLVERPNFEAAGVEITKVDAATIHESLNGELVVYLPKAAQETMENESGETYPVLIVFPPNDERLEIESQGWGQVGIDNDIILVTASAREPELGAAILDYLIDQYPVDESRIYAAGFSGGSHCVMYIAEGIPERFAAITVMDVFDGPHFPDLAAAAPYYDYDIDLPIAIVANSRGTESSNYDGHYNWFDAVQQIYSINEIPQYEDELDFSVYPFWGFPLADQITIEPPTGLAISKGVSYDTDGVPMFCAVTAELEHRHYVEYGKVLWNYMKQFSRETETHEIIYTPAE